MCMVVVDGQVCFVVYSNKTNQEIPVGRHKGVFLFTIIVHCICGLYLCPKTTVSAVFTFVQKLSSCRIPFCDA
jgi:hypothetical protein